MANDVETERPALRLARYLKEFVGHRTPVIKDISRYDTVLWLANMPQEADCRSSVWLDERRLGDAWLEVRKQTFEPVPELPEVVLPWVDEEALKRAIPIVRGMICIPDHESPEVAHPGEEPLHLPSWRLGQQGLDQRPLCLLSLFAAGHQPLLILALTPTLPSWTGF